MIVVIAIVVVAVLLWVLFGVRSRRELDEQGVFDAELGGFVSRAAQERRDTEARARRCEELDGTGAPWMEP